MTLLNLCVLFYLFLPSILMMVEKIWHLLRMMKKFMRNMMKYGM